MTTAAAQPPRLPPPYPQRRQGVNPFAIAITLIVLAVIGAVALFSVPIAAGCYLPFYLLLCYFQPEIALFLMFFAVSFPYDISGGSGVHTAPAEISLCLAFPIFFLRSLATGRPHGSNPIFIPVVIYFIICFIATAPHSIGRSELLAFFQMVLYLVVAVKFFSYCVPSNRQIYAALWGLVCSCTFFSLYLCAFRTSMVLGVHKNATGSFLSYSVLILTEMWLSATSGNRARRWITVLLVINIAGLIMSTSRGAWLGAIAGVGILLVCRKQYALFLRGVLALIPIIAICWLIVPAEQRDYAMDVTADARNVGSRFATIETLYHHFKSSPVIGVGIGLRKEIDDTNVVFSTLAETGVVGFIAFMAMHLVLFSAIFKSTRRVPRNHSDMTFLALGGALVLCLFVHGCFDHYWSRTQLPVWGMVGAAFAVRNGQRRDLAALSARRSGPA